MVLHSKIFSNFQQLYLLISLNTQVLDVSPSLFCFPHFTLWDWYLHAGICSFLRKICSLMSTLIYSLYFNSPYFKLYTLYKTLC